MAQLVSVTAELASASDHKSERILGATWEIRSQIEFDRGLDEAGLSALFSAEDALSRSHANRDLLGMVQFGIATHVGDVGGYLPLAEEFFEEALANLQGVAQYSHLAEQAGEYLAFLQGSGSWEERRDALRQRLALLEDGFLSMPRGAFKGRSAERRANTLWQIQSTTFSLSVVLLEHGDDNEVQEGLELLCDAADPDDTDNFFDMLFNAAIVLDRPAARLPQQFRELVESAHATAQRTSDPSHRAAANFLSGLLLFDGGSQDDLGEGLTHALAALVDAELILAQTRKVALRRAQLELLSNVVDEMA